MPALSAMAFRLKSSTPRWARISEAAARALARTPPTSWADLYDSCQFCDSAGLLTADREAKPAWYVFNNWSGGDPDTVPEAALGGD